MLCKCMSILNVRVNKNEPYAIEIKVKCVLIMLCHGIQNESWKRFPDSPLTFIW